MSKGFKLAFAFALVLALVLLMGPLVVAQGKKSAASKQGTDGEFKTLIDRYYAAWNTGNPDQAAGLYAKEAGLVFYDIAPLKYNGWDEYKEGVKKVLSEFSSFKLTVNDDLNATRRGNVAWTTVTFHASATLKSGGPMEFDGRHTAIWEKRGGQWLIVHEHASAPLPPAPSEKRAP